MNKTEEKKYFKCPDCGKTVERKDQKEIRCEECQKIYLEFRKAK